MKKSISLLLLSLLMIAPSCQKTKEAANEYNIVPKPNQILPQEGRFELNSKVSLVIPSDAPEVKGIADSLAERLKQTAGISLKEAESADGKSAICFVVQEGMPKEGYKLSVTPSLITLTASQPNGFFYGVQTLYQLLPPAVYGNQLDKKANWSVPAVEIEDSPRFVHRGLMLDVCRHYVPIDYIYKFIDLLAMNKMNVFHWHLTDDQGWRIEIKKYPKLTEIGSKREKTLVDYYYVNYPQVFDGKEHGGYYTQEQIKDVVAYAASKYINVVPEIEMPGHALAALAAYPELSCDSTQTYKVSPTWGVFEQVFCPSETTFKFFEGVMDEVIELFPSEYIHIGGDECPKTAWKNSAFCQQLIRQLGLKDDTTPSKTDGIKHSKEDKLQSYFVTRMEKYLNGKGRNIIGWDEILEGHLDFHAHNDYDLAVSNVLAAVLSGVKGLHTTINGLGERAGNAPLASVQAILKDHFNAATNIDESRLNDVSRVVESYSGIMIPANKPIVGENVFTQVAGVHADGDNKNNLYCNDLLPERFGRKREYALGKTSGKANIRKNLEDLGLELDEDAMRKVTERIIELGDKKELVTQEDLPYIVSDVLKHGAIGEKVKLKSYFVNLAHGLKPMATLKIEINGKEYEESSGGDGQYDAFVRALRKIYKVTLGRKFPMLTNYAVTIPPGGRTDAFVQTVITWSYDEQVFRTRGLDADQTEAAIKATMKMLNLIEDEYEKSK